MELQLYFSQLESELAQKLRQKETARRRFVYEISRVGNRLFDRRWSTAWTTVLVPFEILEAMGVAGMFGEFVGGMLAGNAMSGKYLEKAEKAGYSTDGCSYHRTIIGAAREGLLPEPDVLIGCNLPCDGGAAALHRIGELYRKDVFLLHIPYEVSSEAVAYLVDQYRHMIAYVEERTGRRLDHDRLREAIRYNNQARSYLKEAFELCKRVPSPCNSNDFKNFLIYALLSGTEAGLRVARLYRDELKARVDANACGLPGEKYRILWIQNRIQFKSDIIEMLEKNGANIVIDEFNHIYWEEMDESEPLRSLAMRQMAHPLVGPLKRRLDMLVTLACEYKIAGAINPAHWGCRQNSGARHLFKDALQKIAVPVVHLDVDCVDERNYSKGQAMTRLEAFLEMLERLPPGSQG